jgi:hypothetical protein
VGVLEKDRRKVEKLDDKMCKRRNDAVECLSDGQNKTRSDRKLQVCRYR